MSNQHVGFHYGNSSANIVFEGFYDMTCPYSARGFPKLVKLAELYPNDIRVVIYIWPQTWHTGTIALTKGIFAFHYLVNDDKKTLDFIQEIYDNRVKYTDEECAIKTPLDIWNELTLYESFNQNLSADKKDEFIDIANAKTHSHPSVTNLKLHTKYGRQNSIHVSPTILVNGLIDNKISSGWNLDDQWKTYLNDNFGI